MVIEECMEAGITEIILVATEEGRDFYDDYFHNTVKHIYEQLDKQGKEERFEHIRNVFNLPNVIVISQDKKLPYGTAAPIISALPYIGDEPFLHVQADDVILGKSACVDLVETYEQAPDNVMGVIAAQHIPGVDVTRYGIIKLKDNTEDQLDSIIEKPKPEDAPSELVSFGRYLYTPMIKEYLSSKPDYLGKDNELWMVDAIWRMASDHPVLVKPITGEWLTTGDPLNYLKATIKFAAQDPETKQEMLQLLQNGAEKYH